MVNTIVLLNVEREKVNEVFLTLSSGFNSRAAAQGEPFYKGKTFRKGEDLQPMAQEVMEQPPEVIERIKKLFVQ